MYLSRSPDISPWPSASTPMALPSPRDGTSARPIPMRAPCAIWSAELARLWGDGCRDGNATSRRRSTRRICCGWTPPRPAPNSAGAPRWSLDETLRHTVEWYKAFYSGEDVRALTLNQIQSFMQQSKLETAPDVSRMTTEELREQILQLVTEYARQRHAPRAFVPGESVIPPSGKVFGARGSLQRGRCRAGLLADHRALQCRFRAQARRVSRYPLGCDHQLRLLGQPARAGRAHLAQA